MKLSIITINLNNCQGLEKTVLSVINQSYKDFEYIVIDGGSTDGSVELIKKHEDKINKWLSEKDKGIFNAMNKGILQAAGKYLLFMNSGDCFVDNDVLEKFATFQNDEDIIYGNLNFTGGNVKSTWCPPANLSFNYFFEDSLPHQAAFIQKKLFDRVGLYSEQLKICSDWKFFADAVIKFKCTYKKIELFIADFDVNGLSSNRKLLDEEKFKVISNEYANVIYQEYRKNYQQLANYKLSRLIKIIKKIGFLKKLD